MTLIVANLNFDSSGNNKIYVNSSSNSFVLKANTSEFSVNTSSIKTSGNVTVNSSGVYADDYYKQDYLVGDYISLSNSVPQPANTILVGTPYPKSNYSNLVSSLSIQTLTYADAPFSTVTSSTPGLSITYGNGVFLVGGYSGAISTSTDGISWVDGNSANTLTNLYGVAYGNGVFVAAGGDGGGIAGSIQSSTNGTTWTNRTRAIANDVSAVAYGGGVFVAISPVGIQSSTNGTTWTARTSANTLDSMYSIAYGNGVFVACGGSGIIQSSTNGTTWTNRTSGVGNALYNINYGNGVFVAVSSFSGNVGPPIVYSTDGTTWAVSSKLNTPISHVSGVIVAPHYINGVWYIPSVNQTNTVGTYISVDNANSFFWRNARTIPGNILAAGISVNGVLYILKNSSGIIYGNVFSYNTSTHFCLEPLSLSSAAISEKTYVVYQ